MAARSLAQPVPRGGRTRGGYALVVHILDVLSLIVELFAWVGLGVGIPLFIAALAARAADRRWHQVEVEVLDRGDGPPVARWFSDAELHERPLSDDEAAAIHDPDAATGFAGPGGRLRFERHGAPARVLWVLSVVLLGVGVAALAGGIVLIFVGA